MTRYCCLILLVLAISMFLLAGCTSDIEETGGEHAASVEETSDLPNISASTNLEGEILFIRHSMRIIKPAAMRCLLSGLIFRSSGKLSTGLKMGLNTVYCLK